MVLILGGFHPVIRMQMAAAVPTIALSAALTIALAGAPPSGPSKNGAVPVEAASDAAAEPMLARILQAFDKAQRETTSLVAGFTEKKELKLLDLQIARERHQQEMARAAAKTIIDGGPAAAPPPLAS